MSFYLKKMCALVSERFFNIRQLLQREGNIENAECVYGRKNCRSRDNRHNRNRLARNG